MKEDGTGKQYLPQCPTSTGCGDLSHEGIQGQRFFLRVEAGPQVSSPFDVVVYPEDGGSRIVLLNGKSFYPRGACWSPDGKRVAYIEWHCAQTNPDGSCAQSEAGVVVGEVLRDGANTPLGLLNERRIFGPVSSANASGLSWAPDSQTLVFAVFNFVTDSDGSNARTERRDYLAWAPPEGATTIAELIFGSGGALNNLNAWSFSPISHTDAQGRDLFKLAFQRLTETKPYARYDIFITEIPNGYDSSYTLTSTRVTNSANAKNFAGAESVNWSPDGQWLAYAASNGNLYAPHDVYKLKTDGSGKAVNLTNLKTSTAYYVRAWRK
jgi:Tol biopolymer transport system component